MAVTESNQRHHLSTQRNEADVRWVLHDKPSRLLLQGLAVTLVIQLNFEIEVGSYAPIDMNS